MTIKGVICDFGGVLIYSASNEIRQQWADRLHLSLPDFINTLFLSPAALDALRGKITEEQMWRSHQSQFQLGDAELEKLRREVFQDDRVNTPLLEAISILPQTIKKAILSNAWLDARRLFTEQFHFDRVFELMVISAEEGIAKPDEEIYLRTAHRLGLKPWELLFIDDMIENVMTATKLGMAAIHFKDTKSTINQMKTILKSQGVIA